MNINKQALLEFDLCVQVGANQQAISAKAMLSAGDKVVLIGQSGSGKSVLLSALASQLAYQGFVRLYLPSGCHQQHSTQANFWRWQVGLLTQTPVMVEGSVLDNLKLPYQFAQHRQRHFEPAWHCQMLTRFGKSADFLDRDVNALSGGERQLVHFLRMLQLDPAVLLLDEPTAALDEATAKVLIELVNEWVGAQPNRAIIWVSHQPAQSQQLSATLWRMEHGVLDTSTMDKNL